MKKKCLLMLPLMFSLLWSCSDETANSDEISGDDKVFHKYIVNYNQERKSLYAEAELTRKRSYNRDFWLRYSNYDFIKLVGGDKLTFHVFDEFDSTSVLEPTRLSMSHKQVFFGSKTVPYYRLKKEVKLDDIKDKTMKFKYYNSNDSQAYTYKTELLVPELVDVEISSGDVLGISGVDTLTLKFEENVREFDSVQMEFVNSNGNSFYFAIDPKEDNELVIWARDIRYQAEDQSYTHRESRKRRIGRLTVQSKKEKEIPLLLAGIQSYRLNITATRKVQEEVIHSNRKHVISVHQNIKVYSRSIKIGSEKNI